MKVNKNTKHNSIEIDFEGVKPPENVRALMKAYGWWWLGKNKVWCHTLEVDGEFFEKFPEERIRPLMDGGDAENAELRKKLAALEAQLAELQGAK